jgi:hypothetical protein
MTTRRPARASTHAAVAPPAPDPTTTTSIAGMLQLAAVYTLSELVLSLAQHE